VYATFDTLRLADIPLLVEYFTDRFGKKAGKKFRTIDNKSLGLLQAYDWPGNIRELQNVIERAVILCEGETFSVDETCLRRELPVVRSRPSALNRVLTRHEKEMIEAGSPFRSSLRTGARASGERRVSGCGTWLWTGVRPVGRSHETRAAGTNARLENQAFQNQQISVQSTSI
jgi:DNA-binding NtrC family response regulator